MQNRVPIQSKKFNMQSIYKYLIPVILLGLGFEVFLIAPKTIGTRQESLEKSQLSKPLQNDHLAEQKMEGVQLVELKQGEKGWELWADRAYTVKDTGKLILEVVKVKIFGSNGATYYVTGARGEVEVNRKDILITGNVV